MSGSLSTFRQGCNRRINHRIPCNLRSIGCVTTLIDSLQTNFLPCSNIHVQIDIITTEIIAAFIIHEAIRNLCHVVSKLCVQISGECNLLRFSIFALTIEFVEEFIRQQTFSLGVNSLNSKAYEIAGRSKVQVLKLRLSRRCCFICDFLCTQMSHTLISVRTVNQFRVHHNFVVSNRGQLLRFSIPSKFNIRQECTAGSNIPTQHDNLTIASQSLRSLKGNLVTINITYNPSLWSVCRKTLQVSLVVQNAKLNIV